MSFKHRAKHSPQPPKCKQCGVEPGDTARTDGLGRNCGEMIDKTRDVARRHAEGLKK